MISFRAKLRQNFSLGHLAGIILGSVGGYTYWYFYGCTEGCTITGSPVNSTLYFAVMGYMVVGLFPVKKKSDKEQAK
jgi:hypothetical protein